MLEEEYEIQTKRFRFFQEKTTKIEETDSNNIQVHFDAKTTIKNSGIHRDRFRLEFTINKDSNYFEPPSFDNFNVVGGPSQSINNSWINGVRSFSKTYSYFLAPKKTGVFTIMEATIKIDGEVYKTLPIEITVSSAIKKL